MTDAQQRIAEALAELQGLISEAVRVEQLRDQLTSLPNDLALTEMLQGAIDGSTPFWAAFVEVDSFKRINTRFGYESADGLLEEIGKTLGASQGMFPDGAVAVRAHGDEFFLFGGAPDEGALAQHEEKLNQIRRSISSLAIRHGSGNVMNCTVSIGWAASSDTGSTPLTVRRFKEALERAVKECKRHGGDRVQRLDTEFANREPPVSDRTTCMSCKTWFSVEIPADQVDFKSSLRCPVCFTGAGPPAKPETAIVTTSI